MKFRRAAALKGELAVPGDKSISHRAVMFGSLASGTTCIENFLKGADCLSTIDCFRRLGIHIEEKNNQIYIYGKGLHGLKEPEGILDAGNSGTTVRLISGILSGQSFETTLTGDASIQKRPMGRIIEPLSRMGASIESLPGNGCAPLRIQGRSLHGIHYTSPVASAQVKSAILLAGLYADAPTCVTEPALSRDHSERMLDYFGARIETMGTTAPILPGSCLEGRKVTVPGDISSAAYFIAAACIVPGSRLLIRNVGINPTRAGILRVCEKMGADIEVFPCLEETGEPTADILVKSASLKGCTIEGDLIPALIDELPVLAVMACFAEGTTTIRDAAELKVKESNRIDVMTENLSAMGARVTATEDGMIIKGGFSLRGAVIDSHLDHRIAMSFAVAALQADGETEIRGAECVHISYPGFYEDLQRLQS